MTLLISVAFLLLCGKFWGVCDGAKVKVGPKAHDAGVPCDRSVILLMADFSINNTH